MSFSSSQGSLVLPDAAPQPFVLSLDVSVSQRPVIKSTLDLQYFDKCDLPWYIPAAAADALVPSFL